jgi:predicted nucleic acid-binding protein
VFVDSSAYLALLDRRDEHHAHARIILARLIRGRYRQYTTNTVLIECPALILSVLGNRLAYEFLQEISRGNTTIIRVRESDEKRAMQVLGRYTDKDFSFNDAISFAVTERLGISAGYTFDRDFAQYGIPVLQADAPQ